MTSDEPPKRSLLQKYDISITHLDFDYIRSCNKAKEMERILTILKSGEEGFYPDLTRCAEERMQTLNPQSKVLRTEQPLLQPGAIDRNEWLEISNNVKNWEAEAREKKNNLQKLEDLTDVSVQLPPIRQSAIGGGNDRQPKCNQMEKKKMERIRSCDYQQWDKYDAETEILKMDLDVEKVREEVAEKNRKNEQKPLIEVIEEPEFCKGLSSVERSTLADQHRLKGNEYFKSKDYRDAVNEYTQSIAVQKSATAFNNRAMAYLKMMDNKKAIGDCNDCLVLEPKNVKALLRKGQALMNEFQFHEAFVAYSKVLTIEPDNLNAKNSLNDLRKRIPGDLPPPNAVRMKISNKESEVRGDEMADKQDADDLAKLIIPKHLVPNKFSKMAQTMQVPKSNEFRGCEATATNRPHVQKTTFSNNKKRPEIVMSKGNVTTYDNGIVIEEL